jgi:hypothetical protein
VEGPPDNAAGVTKAVYHLRSTNTQRREAASWLLKATAADKPREDVTKGLLPLLDDPQPVTRCNVIEALAVWATPEAVPPLLKAMGAPETRHLRPGRPAGINRRRNEMGWCEEMSS